MINIVNSIDLSVLLKRLTDDIKKYWKDPFKSPVVIFPNTKLEQWFKYNWLKTKENGILLNLEYARMESFLYECVCGNSKKLSKELLRDLIIAKLEKKTGDKFYFEALPDNANVCAYLKEGDGINEVHLYDFASQMASLFADYDVDMLDFDNVLSPNKNWEQKLYNDILADGIKLDFKSREDGETTSVEYKILNRTLVENGFELPEKYKERPIFVFGFSGMGNVHREIIKKIGKSNHVIVYLQYVEDCKVPNKDWTLNGKIEYDEWSNATRTNVEGKTTLPQCSLASAPSKLREVEVLHSEICKLINNKEVRPSDILVVAPNISDYAIEIEHVFEHDSKLNLPYVMTEGMARRSQVAAAFDVLRSMQFKHGLTRADLFGLLHNPVVQAVRGIDENDVRNWLSWVEKMHVFRNNDNIDDWEKAKLRLLTARLTDARYEDGDQTYLPYEDIESQNNSSLSKFIDVVDDAKRWCELSKKSRIDIKDVDEIEELLSSFLHMSGQVAEELEEERMVYAGVRSGLYQQRTLLNCGVQKDLSLRCFMFALKDAIQDVSVVQGLAYLDGMTFTSMKPNRVMTADYVFMLGMDSKGFPGVEKQNVLDVRPAKETEKQFPAQNKNTFFCQLMATTKELHISYVSRDLQKDDVFYPASVIRELKGLTEVKYDIDETRSMSDLYTRRSQRNKEVLDKLKSSDTEVVTETTPVPLAIPKSSAADRVTLPRIREILEDPFEAYANRVFGNGSDEDVTERENSEYEPVRIDDLVLKARIINEYVKTKLEISGGKSININVYVDGVASDLYDQGYFRGKQQAITLVNAIVSEGDKIFDNITRTLDLNWANLKCDENIELLLNSNGKEWLLSGTLEWYLWQSEDELHVFELYSKNNNLKSYVSALAILAAMAKEDKDKKIKVNLHSLLSKEITSDVFDMSPAEAKELLEKIYQMSYVDNYHKCVFAKDVIDGHDYASTSSFLNLINKEGGNWNYFEHKNLIDRKRDLVINWESFLTEYEAAIKKQRGLICFIDKEASLKKQK